MLRIAYNNRSKIEEASSDVIESLNNDKITGNQGMLSKVSASKLETIIYILENYYYKDIDKEAMVDGVYKGIVGSLDDPYSDYYTEDEYNDLMQTLTGNYAGIGALLQKDVKTGEVTITKVYDNTPAEKEGLLTGDSIVSADGNAAVDEDLDIFVQHIRGEAGTDVKLVINRDGEKLDVTCTRASIATPTVEHQMLKGNVGYIAVH